MPRNPSALHLRLLRSAVSITSEDPRWITLLERLWEPFIVARSGEGAIALEISATARGWRFRLGDSKPLSSDDPWLLANEMRHALSELAVREAPHVVDLHAAAVARGGVAMLLVGPSGAGKTSLALALRESGWRLLSDDVAPIEVGTAAILPFPLPLGVKEPQRWTELASQILPPWPPQPASDTFLIPALPMPSSGAGGPGVEAEIMVFTNFQTGAEPLFDDVSAGAALLHCVQFTKRPPSMALPVLARLCSRVRSFRLEYASSEAAKNLLNAALANFGST